MTRFILLSLWMLCALSAVAQTGTISGVVKDNSTGETVIGANVLVAPGVGVTTDLDGKYAIDVEYGDYNLQISFVGFETKTVKVKVDRKNVVVPTVKLGGVTLTEVEIVADVARERETPVAFTTVLPAKIEEELAAQDLPMVLNSTPGVYATQQGGGDGDARISIRGFSQRNVAVMIDGIPVNDMENGRVFWSNWFGLDAITRSVQVQRGLGASKIAIPSVGGTMNILTKGIDAKKGGSVKQEFGNNGYLRTSVGLTTGKMKNGWGFTAAGSFKRGDGWVDQTFTKGWFYFLRAEKKLGNHLIGFSAYGAPQSHGQRSFRQAVNLYDLDYATSVGIDNEALDIDTAYGLQYNVHWGELERYTVNHTTGDTTRAEKEIVNERVNFFHKPQVWLRDFWTVSDKLYISNTVYMSLGNGGGTGLKGAGIQSQLDENRQIDFQSIYNANSGNTLLFGQDLSIDPNFHPTEHKSSQVLAASINNHRWFGGLSTFNYQHNDELKYSGGIDLRTYTGIHYRTVYDLLGGDYYVPPSDEFSESRETQVIREGDRFAWDYESQVNWAGAFGQVEYVTPALSTFLNLSVAYSGYRRTDFHQERDIVIGDDVFVRAVDFGGTFFHNGTEGLSAFNGATITTSGDTTFVDNVNSNDPDGFIVGATPFTIDSKEARATVTDWKWLPGFTIKTGVNYNLNEFHNVYMNVGFISKAQRFDNVINRQNQFYEAIENEKIRAIELGYSIRRKKIATNLNTYVTAWENRPGATVVPLPNDPEVLVPVNLNGMNALHMGVEFDAAYKVNSRLEVEGLVSLGNWEWNSQGSFIIENPNTGIPIDTVQFDADGIKVGDAAQTQFAGSVRYEFYQNRDKKRSAYIKVRYTVFDNYYADFDPIDFQVGNPQFADNFDANGNPRQSWLLPSYALLDIHAGFRFKIGNSTLDLRGSILNAMDEVYISDARNNDNFNSAASTTDFDAKSAAVFFGQGRRFNTSLKISF